MKRRLVTFAFPVGLALAGYLLGAPATPSVPIHSLQLSAEKSAPAALVSDLVMNGGRCVTQGNFPNAVTSGNFPNAVTSGNFPDAVTSGNFPSSGMPETRGASRTLPEPQVTSL